MPTVWIKFKRDSWSGLMLSIHTYEWNQPVVHTKTTGNGTETCLVLKMKHFRNILRSAEECSIFCGHLIEMSVVWRTFKTLILSL